MLVTKIFVPLSQCTQEVSMFWICDAAMLLLALNFWRFQMIEFFQREWTQINFSTIWMFWSFSEVFLLSISTLSKFLRSSLASKRFSVIFFILLFVFNVMSFRLSVPLLSSTINGLSSTSPASLNWLAVSSWVEFWAL